LIDAYCGVGFFGIELAGAVQSFVGIEIDKPGIQSARRNAQRRGITNGEFVLGTTEDLLPQIIKTFSARETTVILDPPRRGCDPSSLDQLRELRPAQIIHISCHPATLARDLKLLCKDGVYELRQVVPLDMFPQTQHVECVADLRCRVTSGSGGATVSDTEPSTN
jgi:23S rRNA (uracil1939-C5)-methyltransferase